MPEREGHDPEREGQEIGDKVAAEIDAQSAADRAQRTEYALGTGAATPEKLQISREIAERTRNDEHVDTENQERAAWRKRCFDAIIVKLEQQGIKLPDATKIILAEVMEKTQGEWNQYNGDPEGVDLGRIDFDSSTQTITIRFESYEQMIGKRIITLTHT